MGSGRYDPGEYTRRTTSKIAAHGTAFVHSKTTIASGAYAIHETLDPKKVAGPGSPFEGKVMREAYDSDDHPEATPIAVIFDVTGSMGSLPPILQTKLPALYGVLLSKGYVEDPQIMFGAIGDATCDRVPLQIGQFESDNRGEEALENLVLEGGGGGGNHESYELAAYYMARHTVTDAWTKRGKKGYLFLIGDERLYATVSRDQVARLIGDTLQDDVPTAEIFAELLEKWEVFFLFAAEGSYTPDQVIEKTASNGQALGWRELVGQNALILEDAAAVCETIALAIGSSEGIDLDEAADDLLAIGADSAAVASASKALATVGAGTAVATAATGDDLDVSDEDGAERI